MTTPAINIFNVGASAAKTASTSAIPEPPEIFMARKKPAKAAGDTVEISELGKALTGKAADLFNSFDEKTRGVLEGLVKSRVVSAKEMTSALHGMAIQALFSRFSSEAAPTAEQNEIAARNRQISRAMRQEMEETTAALGESRTDQMTATPEEIIKRSQAAAEKMKAIKEKYDPDDGLSNSEESGQLMGEYFKITFDRFKQLDLGEDDYRGPTLVSDEDSRNQERLMKVLEKIGVDMKKMGIDTYRYAAGIDIPEIGKKILPT